MQADLPNRTGGPGRLRHPWPGGVASLATRSLAALSLTALSLPARSLIALEFVVLALVGCGGEPVPPPPTNPACMADLAGAGVGFSPWPSAPGGACAVEMPLVLERSGFALVPPVQTACAMASAWAAFAPEVDRIARIETGSGVAAALTAGSWACRAMTGNRSRPSLHASGRAIDIVGFVLTDGRRIAIERDWYRRDGAGRFLRAVGRAACEHFQVVLGPPADSFHRDNLHVDIGPWKMCQVG